MLDFDEKKLLDVVRAAGDAILQVYNTDFDVSDKADDSPLTQADLAAHAVIVQGLEELAPGVPIISEEGKATDYAERQTWSQYWLVDPLDGTKEFVNRNGEFTVNIALIEGGDPVYGVVGVPVQNRIYVGNVPAGQAYCIDDQGTQAIRGRAMALGKSQYIIVASRSHGGEQLEAYLDALGERLGTLERNAFGSSLKLCMLAHGQADCYPRLGPTSEWDIGAAHAVLKAAGGELYNFQGETLRYNTKESLLNPYFVAVADAEFDWWSVLPPLEEQG